MLKDKLKTWNKEIFGNVHNQVRDSNVMLDEIPEKIDRLGHLDILMEQEKSAQLNLENVVNLEEIFWKEKSRVKWNCDGDKNTTYLHIIEGIKNTT